MILFGLGAVLLPWWIIFWILRTMTVLFVVGLLSIPIALFIWLALKKWGRRWTKIDKIAYAVIWASPLVVLLSVGLYNAPSAAWCELVGSIGSSQMNDNECEELYSSWFYWIYLPEHLSNTKAGTPEQKELIKQSLPN